MAVCNESVDECRQPHGVRLWLGAGAVTLGMGAAILGAAGVAAADTDSGSSGSASNSGSTSSNSDRSSDDSKSDSSKSDDDAPGRPARDDDGDAPADSVHSDEASADDDDEDVTAADDESEGADSLEPESEPVAGDDDESEAAPVVAPPAPAETAETVEVIAEPVSDRDDHTAAELPVLATDAVREEDTVIVRAAATTHSAQSDSSTTAGTLADAEPVLTAPTALITAAAAPNWSLPTPNQVFRALQQFGTDLYTTAMHQIRGAQRNLTVLREDLVRMLGIRQIVIVEDAPYGNPLLNQQYWAQQNFYSHTLAAAAMAWAQLTGTAVNVQELLDLAADADSLYADNQKVYVPGLNRFVSWTDSFEVLQSKGVRILTHFYAQDQQSHALHALTTGLQDPAKAQMIILRGPIDGFSGTSPKAVVVIGVDTEAGTVTYNDPTRSTGQGATMDLDDFLSSWGNQNYSLITAQLAATAGSPSAIPVVTRTRWTWELPRPDRLGLVIRNLGTMIVETAVNQIDGVQRNLVDLSDDLARTFGIASLIEPEPPAPGDVEYGNYTANKPFWNFQGDAQSCAIMASAGIIGQLTGVLPTQQQILEQAWSTPSDVYPGQAIFEGDGDVPGKHWGTNQVDVLKLLNLNGIDADVTTFLRSQRQLALDTLTASLTAKQGVMASVNADLVWKAYENTYFKADNYNPPAHTLGSNHMVIVLSVNTTKNVVYLNDSAWEHGQGLPVPLDKFLDAWQTGGHTMITAKLADAAGRSTA